MKCIQCNTDNDLRDRTNHAGRCKNCGHQFAFEPTATTNLISNFTDVYFANAIQAVSENNTLYFTPKQFFYLLERRFRRASPTPKQYLILSIIFFVIGTFLLIFVIGFLLWIVALAMAIASVRASRRLKKPLPFRISQTQVQDWLHQWQTVNGALEKLLPPPQAGPPQPINNQVAAYSFDRAVICDSDSIAQFLIANNFHFENNCAVLSMSGYPQSVFLTVINMLKRNPNLRVYALHSADPRGMSLVHRLRTDPAWFANQAVEIIDIGLTPRQVLADGKFIVRESPMLITAAQQLPIAVRQSLSTDEQTWLDSGNYVELAAFTPARLLRILNYGIAQSEAGGADAGIILIDSGMTPIYTVDSFG